MTSLQDNIKVDVRVKICEVDETVRGSCTFVSFDIRGVESSCFTTRDSVI